MQSMPHLVRWYEELGDFGLVIVAPHCQDVGPEKVKATAAGLGIRFPVPNNGTVPGAERGTIPHMLVFDHAGKCLFEGHPTKAEAAVRQAVGGSLVAAAKLATVPKSLTSVVDGLKKGQSPKTLLPKLLSLKSSSEKDTAAAARALADAVLGFAQKRLDDAVAAGPIDGYDTATRMAVSMKGTPVGTKASQTAIKLKTDKAVAEELKVRPSLEKLRALAASVESASQTAKLVPNTDAYKKAYGAQLKQVDTLYKQMKKAAPDAPATHAAADIVNRIGVD
jgi:hypothetical protein